MVMLEKAVTLGLSLLLLSSALMMGGLVLMKANGGTAWFFSYQLLSAESLSLELPVLLDDYSLSFLASVALIGASVLTFSRSYMQGEKYFVRFHLLVLSFIASMFLLIVSPNLISVMLGWDGLGVTSYLLVIYFQSAKSYNAGMITALSNRVGDALIMVAIALGAQGLCLNFALTGPANSALAGTLLATLAVAACTKSAQIPFSAWLPAAMAAPTPVSSLVHSSTLVTAGVYLVFRLSASLTSMWAASGLFVIGSLTMLMAGATALYETDMKKIVALSTLSQLGVMMLTLGGGYLTAGFFHLLSHAYFKALLFMTVGAMIHSAGDFQDMRKTSISVNLFPLTLAFSLGANLSLCGLPFMSGFFSKDLCIELAAASLNNLYASLVLYVGTLLTAAYTARFIFMLLITSLKTPTFSWARDKDGWMNSSMVILYVLAVGAGGALSASLFYSPQHLSLALEVKNLTLVVVVCGGLLVSLSGVSGLSPKASPRTLFYLWGLPFFSAQLWAPGALKMGAAVRGVGDLAFHAQVFGQLASSPQASTSKITLEGRSANLFRGVALALALSLSALLYLHMMNLSISFKVKA